MADSDHLERPLRAGDSQALLAVGDHLELVVQLVRGQAAAQSASDGGGLEALLAALSRSSAALGDPRTRAPDPLSRCAAAERHGQAARHTHFARGDGEGDGDEAWQGAAAGPSAPRPGARRRGGDISEGTAGVREAFGQTGYRPPPRLVRGDSPALPEDGGAVESAADGSEEDCRRKVSPRKPTVSSGGGDEGTKSWRTSSGVSSAVDEEEAPRRPGRSRTTSRMKRGKSGISFFGEGQPKRSQSYRNPVLRTMQTAMESHWMECVSAFFIALNTFFMILEGQYTGARVGYEIGVYSYYGSDDFFEGAAALTPDVFAAMDIVFCVVFTIELLLRLCFLRLDFLCDPWGWLDIAIVVSTDITTFLFQGENGGGSMPVTTLRVLRLARLLRIMKLARSITAFDSLYLMTTAISGSVSALFWVIVFLLVAQTLFALLLTNIVQDFYLETSGDGDGIFRTDEEKRKVYEYFGTYWRAMVSLFELMLANWPPICRTMMETMHEAWSVVALSYKLVMGVAVIGVIMGVFTQETFRAAETDDHLMIKKKALQTKTHAVKMKKLFQKMSTKQENVDVKLFEDFLHNPKMRMWLKAMDYDVSDAKLIFSLIDADGDGNLTVDELIEGMASLKGGARNIDVKLLMRHSRDDAVQQASRNVHRMTAADALKMVEAPP